MLKLQLKLKTKKVKNLSGCAVLNKRQTQNIVGAGDETVTSNHTMGGETVTSNHIMGGETVTSNNTIF